MTVSETALKETAAPNATHSHPEAILARGVEHSVVRLDMAIARDAIMPSAAISVRASPSLATSQTCSTKLIEPNHSAPHPPHRPDETPQANTYKQKPKQRNSITKQDTGQQEKRTKTENEKGKRGRE